MKITIKNYELDRDGIEFEVRNPPTRSTPAGKHRGDVVLTDQGLIWCPGRTQPANGKLITWQEFIRVMNKRAG